MENIMRRFNTDDPVEVSQSHLTSGVKKSRMTELPNGDNV